MIACVVLREFAVAVERRDHPAFAAVAVILSAGDTVYAASDEAQTCGIAAGMSVHRARLLCPAAQVHRAQVSNYRLVFERLVSLLSEFTHLLEPENGLWQHKTTNRRRRGVVLERQGSKRDAVLYLNLEALNFDATIQLAETINQHIQKKAGLYPCIGLATGKNPAFIAALTTVPGTVQSVPAGNEATFLADQPIDMLPLDKETDRRLRLFGIETVGQLAQLPAGAVSTQFGKMGKALHQLATGHDTRPVIPIKLGATIRVIRQLDGPVQDRLVLDAVLRSIAQETTIRLHMDSRMARRVDLLVQLENGNELGHALTLRRPTMNQDHLSTTLTDMLTHLSLRSGVLTLIVSLDDFVPATGQQLELFPHAGSQDRSLRETLVNVIARHGAASFYWLTPSRRQSRLPGSAVAFTPVDHR